MTAEIEIGCRPYPFGVSDLQIVHCRVIGGVLAQNLIRMSEVICNTILWRWSVTCGGCCSCKVANKDPLDEFFPGSHDCHKGKLNNEALMLRMKTDSNVWVYLSRQLEHFGSQMLGGRQFA